MSSKSYKNVYLSLFIYKRFIAKFDPAASVSAPFFSCQTKTRPVHFLYMDVHVPKTPRNMLKKL